MVPELMRWIADHYGADDNRAAVALGVNPTTARKWRRGETNVSLARAPQVEKATGIPAMRLLYPDMTIAPPPRRRVGRPARSDAA